MTVEREPELMTPSFNIDDCLADSFDNLSLGNFRCQKNTKYAYLKNISKYISFLKRANQVFNVAILKMYSQIFFYIE